MKVTQEKLPASQIGLEIEVPAENAKKTYDKVVNNLLRTVRIPGFRPGKVPRQVLMQRFGAQSINSEVVQELIDSSIKKAMEQENITAIGGLQLRSSFDDLVADFDPAKSLTFSAAFDVQPEVTLKTSSGFKLKAEEIKPELDQVDKTLDGYRTQMATLVPVEGRAIKVGDVAVVDFHGRYTPADGGEEKDVPGGKAENFSMDIETDRFIPGFVDGVIGMKSGETREIITQFPIDYGSEDVAGCDAKFSITVHEIKERELPELDDEFATEVSDGEFETIADLRGMLEERYTDEAADKTQQNKETAMLAALLEQVEVDLPATLVEQEVDSMLMQSAYQLQSQGIDVRQLFNQETVPRLKENSRPEAINRIKRTMALGEIAKQQKLEVLPSELDAKVAEALSEMGDTREIDPERLRSALQEEILKEKIMAWVEANSTIELVPAGSLAPANESTSDDAGKAIGEASAATVEVEAVEVPEEKPASKKAEAKSEGKSEGKAKKSDAKPEEKSKAAKEDKPKAEDKPKSEDKSKDKSKDKKSSGGPKKK
jgi:trigger factor